MRAVDAVAAFERDCEPRPQCRALQRGQRPLLRVQRRKLTEPTTLRPGNR